MEFIQTLVAYY